MRIWFAPLPRPVSDVDLAATFPFDVDVAGDRLRDVLTCPDVEDGVAFDADRVRIQGIWLQSEAPGVRMYAVGEALGERQTFSVDVTFGEELVPAPERGDYPMSSGDSVPLWMCRPETITGRKLHALWRMGLQHWRAKDLMDVCLILDHTEMNSDELAAAIAASFTSRGDPADGAASLFVDQTWWSTRTAAARWSEFTQKAPSSSALMDTVASVANRLRPVFERLQ